MLFKLKYVFTLILNCVFVLSFKIPEHTVEIYHPRGFRVIIPNEDGMELYGFHGNINAPMNQYEVGQYYKDVLKPINGQWIYEDKVARLRKGDVIYFWLYVLHDKVGYRKDNQIFRVKDVIRGGIPAILERPAASSIGIITENNADTIQVYKCCEEKRYTMTQQQMADDLQNCEQTVLKLTPKLISQHAQIETLTKTNDLLSNIIETRPEGKKLTLNGRISSDGDPMELVSLILNEKLNLKPRIVSATRNSDKSITFELTTVNEMANVFLQAQDKLKNSKVVSITY